MKMLVYSFPLTCEFVVLSVEHCRESEAHELLDTYETGKKKYHIEDGELLAYNNAWWLVVDVQEDIDSPGRAVRSACDEFWRQISKDHFKRSLRRMEENSVYGLGKENNEADDN